MDQKKQSYVTLTDSNFSTEVLQRKEPVLVDFWAPWCGPCQAMGPVIRELAEEFQANAIVGKLNVDDHQEVAVRYGIQSIPTLLIFQDGKVVDKAVGTMSKTALAQKLENLVQVA